MRAFGFENTGTADVIEEVQIPNLRVQPSTLLVTVLAVGLNNRERLVRAGIYPSDSDLTVLGTDFVGRVEAIGARVKEPFKVGDLVIGRARNADADQVLVMAEDALPLPTGLSPVIAAASITPSITAFNAVNHFAEVQAGNTVVIRGAAGGVGSVALQLIHQMGAHTIAIAAERSRKYVESIGADVVLPYDLPVDLKPYVHQADVVFNFALNGAGSDQDLHFLKPTGQLATVSRSIGFGHGPQRLEHIHPLRQNPMATYSRVLDEIVAGLVTIRVDEVLPFDLTGFQTGQRLLDGHHDGRIVVSRAE